MAPRRTSKSFQVSAETDRAIEQLGVALDLSRADVLARAIAELARRHNVSAPEPKGRAPRRRPSPRRTIADPPGPISRHGR